ncbi:MAG: phosphorylase [Acidobacteriaceae bacterium]
MSGDGNRPRHAIIAALPREVTRLVRGVKRDAGWAKHGVWLYRLEKAVVAAAGMGAERAKVAVEAALSAGEIEILVSTGLAGGCRPGLAAGTVLEATWVVEAETGERFRTLGWKEPWASEVVLVTMARVAGVVQKAEMARRYGAAMVDMEAASVARMAQERGLGFRAIKGISDRSDVEMGSLEAFTGEKGSFRTGAFALHMALRPREWRRALALGRGSAKALAGLEASLREVLQGCHGAGMSG